MEMHLDDLLHGLRLREWIVMLDEGAPHAYLAKMKRPGTWGGGLEIAVMAEVIGRPICVFIDNAETRTCSRNIEFIPDRKEAQTQPVISILYTGRSHYSALIS
jgi:hypothetical protein